MPSALAVVRPPGANMVNPKLRYCVLASRCWAEGDSSRVWAGKFPQRASKLRHSCNRFQRCRIGAAIALELRSPFSYLIGGWRTQAKQLGPRQRA